MTQSDAVFWTGYAQGKRDGEGGKLRQELNLAEVDQRWHVDFKIGYGEGYYDGQMAFDPRKPLAELT